MPVEAVENFIRQNQDKIKSHSWVTAPLDNYEDSHVIGASINNMVSFRSFPQSVYAIQPNYFQTADSYFLDDYGAEFDTDTNLFTPIFGHPHASGLDWGEQLYTARGS